MILNQLSCIHSENDWCAFVKRALRTFRRLACNNRYWRCKYHRISDYRFHIPMSTSISLGSQRLHCVLFKWQAKIFRLKSPTKKRCYYKRRNQWRERLTPVKNDRPLARKTNRASWDGRVFCAFPRSVCGKIMRSIHVCVIVWFVGWFRSCERETPAKLNFGEPQRPLRCN